jgi:hypothetical protein
MRLRNRLAAENRGERIASVAAISLRFHGTSLPKSTFTRPLVSRDHQLGTAPRPDNIDASDCYVNSRFGGDVQLRFDHDLDMTGGEKCLF